MYPNGITITNTYDSLNRLTSTTSKKPDGTSVITGEYKYDAAGNVRYILQETAENKHLLLVSYDDYDRMVKEEMKVDGDMYTAQPEWDHSYDDADNYNGWSEYVVIPGPGVRFVTGGRSHTQMNSLNQVGKTIYFPGDSMEARYGYDEMGNMAQIISFYYNAPVGHQEHIINYTFDGFGRMIKIENEERIIEYEYDYRGRLMRRVERELPDGENVETARMSYSGGTSVLEKNVENTLRFYRGSDMGGGVGGLLYAENADSSGLNYKHYNLRGDIVATTDSGGSILSELRYLGNGDIKGSSGTQPADKFKHNTKRVEDGFVNEGRRYRDIEMMRFTSPDPLEYIDGLNCYAYCGNNPWGRFDPYGLDWAVQNYPRSPQKEMRDGGIWHRKVNPGVPNIWIAFLGSCDTPVNIDKDFIAVQIDIVVKDFDGKIKLRDSVVVANKISKENTTEKNGERYVNNLKIKGFLQDEGNYMNIVSNEDEIEISVRPALYSGSPNDYGFYETDVTVADWDDKQHEYYGDIKNQTQDKWSAYSQTKNDSHDKKFISKSAKTLDQIKDKNGNAPKAKDIAKSPTTSKIDAF